MPNEEFWARAAELNEQFRPVELTDEIVTRRAGPQSVTVHSFLRHLRDRGLDCVPEPLSLNGNTETLRYIDGDSGGDGWQHQHDERGLRSAARLLRRIHDASIGWQPPDDAVFDAPPTEGAGDLYCHGDPGPWNFVWRNGEAVALIDWDFLHPAPRLDDVAYALLWFAPMRDDAACLGWHHFPEVPDRRERITAFLDAYGTLPVFDVAEAVIRRRRATIEHVRSLADQGVEPQRTWVAEGSLEEEAAEIDWIVTNRSRFTLRRRISRGLPSTEADHGLSPSSHPDHHRIRDRPSHPVGGAVDDHQGVPAGSQQRQQHPGPPPRTELVRG